MFLREILNSFSQKELMLMLFYKSSVYGIAIINGKIVEQGEIRTVNDLWKNILPLLYQTWSKYEGQHDQDAQYTRKAGK